MFRPRGGLAGLLQRLLVGALGLAALVAAMVFWFAALLMLLALGAVFGGWWWWKLRGLRRTLRAAGTNARGVVIEGEVLREESTPPRLPPGAAP